MNAVLDHPEVDAVLAEARRLGELRYQSTAIALADDQAVDAGEINAAVAAAAPKRSMATLQKHLDDLRSRRESVNNVALASELEVEQEAAATLASKLHDEIRAEEQKFNERMAPKRLAQSEANEKSQRLHREIRDLRRNSIRVLNETASPELRAEFGRLSNRTVRLANEVTEAKRAVGRAPIADADAAIADARARLDRWEAQPDSPIRTEGVQSAQQRLEQAVAARDELTKIVDRLAQLEAEHAEAIAAMETFKSEEWTDWRQLNFG